MKMQLIRISPKECPFCHNMPVIRKEPLWNGSHGYHDCYEYYVACENEKCKVNPRTSSYNDIYDMKEQECIEKALEDWNER